MPSSAVSVVGGLVRRTGLVDFSPEQMQFLNYGRVVDATRLRTGFGYTPRYTTASAYESFLAGRPVLPLVPPERLRSAEHAVSAVASAVGTVLPVRGGAA